MYAENLHTTNNSHISRNAFVDAFNELKLNWAVDLNEPDIHIAFQHFVELYNKQLAKGIQPYFNLDEKEKAKLYLLRLCK